MSDDILVQIKRRFGDSVESSFSFLETEFAFSKCGLHEVDLSDIRDATLHCRYLLETIQIEVRLGLAILQPGVYIRQFGHAAECSVDDAATRVIVLEQFALSRGRIPKPPLPWMRTLTFYDEAAKSYRRLSKNMSLHLEEAVGYLGKLLFDLVPALLAELHVFLTKGSSRG
jgi:hypothetical protein